MTLKTYNADIYRCIKTDGLSYLYSTPCWHEFCCVCYTPNYTHRRYIVWLSLCQQHSGEGHFAKSVMQHIKY